MFNGLAHPMTECPLTDKCLFILERPRVISGIKETSHYLKSLKSSLKRETKYGSEHSNDVFKSVEHTFRYSVVQ